MATQYTQGSSRKEKGEEGCTSPAEKTSLEQTNEVGTAGPKVVALLIFGIASQTQSNKLAATNSPRRLTKKIGHRAAEEPFPLSQLRLFEIYILFITSREKHRVSIAN